MVASASLASMNGFATGEGSNGGSAVDFDTTLLQKYLVELLPPLLSADVVALNQNVFHNKAGNWSQVADAFARDSSVPVVYINQIRRS